MGHHGGNYGFGGGGTGLNPEALRGMPRGFKIALALIALFILLVGAAGAVLVVLVLVKLVAGGTLPSYFQNAFDFLQRNLGPLLNLWESVQRLTGK